MSIKQTSSENYFAKFDETDSQDFVITDRLRQ